MQCPRCGKELERVDMVDAGVHTQAHLCVGCRGHYFSNARLDVLQDVVKVEVFPRPHTPTKGEQLQPLTCPACGGNNTMVKVPSPRNKEILMDVCRACGGTWLDPGELEAIQAEGLMKFFFNMIDWFRKN